MQAQDVGNRETGICLTKERNERNERLIDIRKKGPVDFQNTLAIS